MQVDAPVLRVRNKVLYRLAHWPIWIFVFFLVPGPEIFRLFANGWTDSTILWLAVVICVTGAAGLAGRLPGVESKPYILRFTEDRPNPLYRRICYTFAWSASIAYAALNFSGLVWAVATGEWALRQIYETAYLPVAGAIWVLGVLGRLPRVKSSTAGEGDERRYFYGAVWTVFVAQPLLGLLWLTLPREPWTDIAKLIAYSAALLVMCALSWRGYLPRTRRIVPGAIAVRN